MTAADPPETWRIHFFRQESGNQGDERVPAKDFLDSIPPKCAAEVQAVLEAVASAPPPAFSGGGKWEAMHGDMAGFYEVRVQSSGYNHRLFCLLERDAPDLGGPSVVCLGGLSKRPRSAAKNRDYRSIRRYADDFRRGRGVME
jgi:hypothetical protein